MSEIADQAPALIEADPIVTELHPTPPKIGQPWPGHGGIYAGLCRGEAGQADYHLVVSTSEADELPWGSFRVDEPGAKFERDGQANTAALVDSEHDHPASQWAHELRDGGHVDWYLPSRREAGLLSANVPELFDKSDWYWTSTQYSPITAWVQGISTGTQDGADKDFVYRARAVRRVSVIE